MSVYPIILTQSEFKDKDSLNYPFEERGLQFGDGIYEVIRVYEGKYYLFEEHVDRLYRSAEAIKIEIPQSKKEMKELLLQLITKNEMTTDGKVYMQITRGSAPRDHIFPQSVEPNMYAYVQDMPRNKEALQHGVSTITQPDIRWENCYIKSLNLLPNVLAKQTAKEQGCYEAILHRDGKVTECSASNVYLVKNGKVYTHPTTNNILYGCVRMAVERFLKAANIELIEEAFQLEDISSADEIFLSSSTSEVTPIVRVDDKAIGDGKPGTITKQLQRAYETEAAIKDKLTV
ncbi:D-alanine aminotransferase [Oceanobacillus iheyensis HTE831]|uniref:D-alanine aminotransferase n=1 Tax=Oceanobacillus iheyensis (strain DSM 14371 / CIP 107618 / JCM 11309 / KCTC 3954 / HTE831) TaxID=221109 RepID=Q8CUM4_OCEIH|nr:D-amino-acid transaminase [Oceanobacillus iheyensis]BAC13039.1 D-alanine aminotransferase [Oceanobacillus iheyensis HTE831]